ncbi:hypothetical protein ABPG72_000076 [Tetrahymena utriculariae]
MVRNQSDKFLLLLGQILRVLIFISYLPRHAYAGQIFGGDVDLDFGNAQKMSIISFKFQLQTSLMRDDFLKINFPFSLHNQLRPSWIFSDFLSVPFGLQVTWRNYDQNNQPSTSQNYAQVFTDAVDSSTYYIRLLDQNQLITSVPSQVWNQLTFTIKDSQAMKNQKSNQILQISMSTISSVSPNAIIYDENLAFNFFYLQDVPSTSIGVSLVNYDKVNFNQMGFLQTISIDIDFTQMSNSDLQDDLRLVFSVDNQEFMFQGECFSATRYELPIINPILSQYIQCTIDNKLNQMNVQLLKGALTNQTAVRIQTYLMNPLRVIAGVSLEVKVLRLYSSLIVAIGSQQSVLQTVPINVIDHQIYMAWGLRPDSSLPLQLKIVRSDQSGTYQPMNSFRVVFQIDVDSPQTTELKVNILIGNADQQASIVGGSIASNLPPCPNKQVVCSESSKNNPSKRKIACSGVCYLRKATPYQVSFKMVFPYSTYQDPIDCSNFGALSIQSATYSQNQDIGYIFARSKGFQSPGFNILQDTIPQDSSQKLITNLQNFPFINMLLSARDFQDYTDDEIYSHSLIYSASDKLLYSQEFILPSNSINFLNYANQFSDLQIFKVTFNSASNFISQYDSNLITQMSVPKNVLSINTINGKNWVRTPASNAQVIVSSQSDSSAISSVTAPNLGIQISQYEQRLVWNTLIPLSDITQSFTQADVNALTPNSPPITIPNGAGFVLLFNQNFVPQTMATGYYFERYPTSNQHMSMKVTYSTSTSVNAYNKYTSFQLVAQQHLALDLFYSSTNNEQQWGLRPFIIQGFSSIYVDDYVFDIYVNTIDGINGPANQQQVNSYVLINAFVIQQDPYTTSSGGTTTYWLRATISNYYSGSQNSNTGRYIPVLFKIQGNIPSTQASQTQRIVIFFDNGSPFYNNIFSNEINCASTTGSIEAKCKGYQSNSLNINNYLTLSRIEVELSSYTSQFIVIIPIKAQVNVQTVNFFVGLMSPHSYFTGPTNQDKMYGQLWMVRNAYSLTYPQTTLSAAPIIYNSGGSITNIQNGLKCISNNCQVGIQQASMTLSTSINQSNMATSPIDTRGILVNSNMNQNKDFGSAFTFVAAYQFFNTNSNIAGWSNYIFFRYKYYELQSDTQIRVNNYQYGVYCSNDGAISSTGTMSNVNLFKWAGQKIPAFSTWSYSGGNVATISSNYYKIDQFSSITGFTASSIGTNIQSTVLNFNFNSPFDLDQNFYIILQSNNNVNLPFANDPIYQQCQLLIQSLNPMEDMQSLTQGSSCQVVSNTNQQYVYMISSITNKFPQNSLLSLNHYLANSPLNGSTSSVIIQISSTAVGGSTDIIAQSSSTNFVYDLTQQATKLILNNFASTTDNRSIVTTFSFSMAFQSKQMWAGEYYLINTGALSSINLSKANQLRCMVLENDQTPSHRFGQVQYNQLSNMYFYLKYPVFNNTPSFYVQCKYMIMPTSLSSNIPLSMRVEFPINRQIINFVNLNFPTFLDITTGTISATITKHYDTPGSNLELFFNLTSSVVNMNQNSRVVIVFPIYYSPNLGRDGVVNCYLMPSEDKVSCFVTEERTLDIRYFSNTYAPGTQFIIKVTGVTQPQFFQTYQLFIAFDNDTDDTSYSEYLFISDVINTSANSNLQNNLQGLIEIRSITIQSLYLREAGVQYQFNIYINPNVKPIVYGQAIMINFPPIYQYVLEQNIAPDCSVTSPINPLQNFVGSCHVSGLRIKMFVNQQMNPGNFYNLTVFTIRNPSRFDSSVYKWIIEVSDITQQIVVLRSFGMSANFNVDTFIQNPNQNYLNFFDGPNFNTAQQVTSLNMIQGVMSKWLYVAREKYEPAWCRSFLLTSKSYPISTFQIETFVVVGTQVAQIRVYSPNAIGFYAFQTYKYGDGDYYSDLPILQLTFDNLNLQPFLFNEVTLNVMSSATQSPLLITLGALPPVNYVTVNFSILPTANNIGLKLIGNQNVAQVNITNSLQMALLNIQVSNPAQFIPGSKTSFQFTLSGANANSYKIQGGVLNIVVVSNPSSTLQTFIQSSSVIPTNPVNSKNFEYKCSQLGLFYYYVAFSYPENSLICQYKEAQIISLTWQQSTEDNSYGNMFKCFSQFGVVNVQQTTDFNILTINNLLATRNYIFGGFCQSQRGDQNPTQYISFQAQSNNGKLYKIEFDFINQPSLEQIVKLACFLSIHFYTHPTLVSTLDGVYCSELAHNRILKAQEDQQQEINDFDFDKNKRMLDLNQYYLNLKNNKINLTTCVYQNIINTTAQQYPIIFYMNLNEYLQNDDLFQRLAQTTQNGCFKDYVTQGVIGIPSIVNIQPAIQVQSTPPSLSFNINQNFYFGLTWVFLDSLTLNSNGRFWGILILDTRVGNNVVSNLPTPTQIRNGLNQDGSNALSSFYFFSDSTNNRVSNVTFSGLFPGKKYLMVYVVSNEDPFDTVNYDFVKYLEITTQQPIVNSTFGLVLKLVGFSTLLLIILML